jgi:hypothetical protein
MAEPSIGQAIALQGQTNNSLRMAQSLGQGLGRKAAIEEKKRGRQQQEQQKQEDQLMAYFKDKGRMHRLVLPEMNKIFDETIDELQRVKSSENPYATNDYSRIERNLRGRLIELDSFSNALHAFDKQVDYRDENKRYYGDKLESFIPEYSKMASLGDLKRFAEQNRDLQDGNLKFDPSGIPLLNEESALPFLQDLSTQAKNLNEVISYRSLVSVPGVKDTKNMQSVYGKPLYIKDAEQAFKDNPNLYPNGKRPTSLEDLVDNYMTLYGEDLIRQANTKFGLGIKKTSVGYLPEDIQKVKDNLIPYMAQFSNPELKDKIIQEKKGFTFNMPGDKSGPGDIAIGLATQELQTPGETLDGKPISEADRKLPRNIRTLATMEVGTDNVFLQATDQVRDRFGNKPTGDFNDALLVGIRLMPYRTINGVRVPARTENSKEIEGVTPFVQFARANNSYFTPLVKYANKAIFAGSKFNAESFTPVFKQFYTLEDKINKAIQGKKFKNQQEFDNFVKPLLAN